MCQFDVLIDYVNNNYLCKQMLTMTTIECIITSTLTSKEVKMNAAARKYDIMGNHNDYEQPISEFKSMIDAFSSGNNVKGLAVLNHTQRLSVYAEELVASYAKFNNDQYELSLDKLPDDEQSELARLFIEATDRDVSECVYGDDFTIESDFTCALLSMLKSNTQESRENFAQVTLKNVIVYHKKPLQNLLDDACEIYFNSMMNEQGLHAQYDTNHGDVVWRG